MSVLCINVQLLLDTCFLPPKVETEPLSERRQEEVRRGESTIPILACGSLSKSLRLLRNSKIFRSILSENSNDLFIYKCFRKSLFIKKLCIHFIFSAFYLILIINNYLVIGTLPHVWLLWKTPILNIRNVLQVC